MNSRKLSVAAERAVILQFMDAKVYWDLYKKYGHKRVYEAFAAGLATIQKKPSWRMRLWMRVRRLRMRLQRVLNWMATEVPDADKA